MEYRIECIEMRVGEIENRIASIENRLLYKQFIKGQIIGFILGSILIGLMT